MAKKEACLQFLQIDNAGRKTKAFDVYNGTMCLGQVRYFTRWRAYAFFPLEATVYDAKCLHELTVFCDGLRQRKNNDA